MSSESPATWSNEEFRVWVGKTSAKLDPIKFAPFESGKQMCELDEQVFIQRCLESQKDGLMGTDKALTEKGAKAFYDKLWGLICTWTLLIPELCTKVILSCGEAKCTPRGAEDT